MTPDELLVATVLDGLLPGGAWRTGEQAVARRAIRRIGSCIGLYSARYEWVVPEAAVPAMARLVIRAVHAEARALLPTPHATAEPGPYRIALHDDDGAPLTAASVVPLVNVNTASLEALDALPGLGPKSAARVVRYRGGRGQILDADTLRDAAEISQDALDRLLPTVYFGPPEPLPALAWVAGTAGFPDLVAAVESGALAHPTLRPGRSTRVAAGLLSLVAERIESRRRWSEAYTPDPRALIESSVPEWTPVSGTAGQVLGSGYPVLLEALLGTASRRIHVAVFYFSEAIAERLVPLLSEAASRGVEVRLVLGDDLDDDYHGARLVNEAADALLRDAGLGVRRGPLDQTLHAKVAIVDDVALVGSHNWTAGSFWRYRDVSLACTGPVVDQTAAWVDHLWRWCDPDVATRSFDLHRLELCPPSWAGPSHSRDFVAAVASGDADALAAAWNVDSGTICELDQIARLLHAFRIGEVTARLLIHAGLGRPEDVRAAGAEALHRALYSDVPDDLVGRRVPAGVDAYLAEGS